MRARALGAAVLACAFSSVGVAQARPQGNASLITGVCGNGSDGALWQDTFWCNGLRADILFGRERGRDFALGPYVQISSAGFWDARYGAGLSLLAPLNQDFPLVLSLGAGGHELEAAQLEGWLFWGARTYNFHASYSISAGLLLGASHDLSSAGRNTLFVGAQIDGLILALPFLLAYEAVAD